MSRLLRNPFLYYDPALLVLAAAACLGASFIALAIVRQREEAAPRPFLRIWLAATVLGGGIWSMHLLARLALPRSAPLSFDQIGLFGSIIPAILSAGIGFSFSGRGKGSTWMVGSFIGAGFVMMQYTWAGASIVTGTISWHWNMVALSVVLCMALSLAAMAVRESGARNRIVLPGLLLALAMICLHIVATGAADFHPDVRAQAALNPGSLMIVAVITLLLILTTALSAAILDRMRMRRKLNEVAELKRLADELIASAAERERLLGELKRQYDITHDALNNMAHGLCMYDENSRLVVWNRRYVELSNFPDDFLRPGMPFDEIVRYQIGAGNVPMSTEQYKSQVSNWLADSGDRELSRPDGRTYHVHREPLENGGWILTHEDITERRRASDRISYLASHDELTGLSNRRSFADAMQDAARRGRGFALLTIDLDRFKEVNDTLGHPVGDAILKETAVRLRSIVGGDDVVTRLGGDEFAVLQREVTSEGDSALLADSIVELLGKPYAFDGHTVVVGATLGIALATTESCDAEELAKRSDLALYRAKQQGRGSYCFFEPGMDAHLLARREMEMGLRVAIQRGEFELYYQPLLNVQSRTISGFEALVRWHHPVRGLLLPAEFIPAAEDSGLIIPLGEWVLRQACREAAHWPESVNVSVNLSAAQLKRGDLLAMTKSALAAARLAPERLEIELTESVLLHDEDWVRALLLKVRALGIRIAMDDFGTGYSSLSYLRTFPFSKIKIDKSFVADLDGNNEAFAIVQATIGLSMKLGMTTTAEGVETAEQLQILADEGCTEVQGFGISAPVPADQVPQLLLRYGTSDDVPHRIAS